MNGLPRKFIFVILATINPVASCGTDTFSKSGPKNLRTAPRTLDAQIYDNTANGADRPLPSANELAIDLSLRDATEKKVLADAYGEKSLQSGQIVSLVVNIAAGRNLIRTSKNIGLSIALGGITNPTLIASTLELADKSWSPASWTNKSASNYQLNLESSFFTDSENWQNLLTIDLVIPKETPDDSPIHISATLIELEDQIPYKLIGNLIEEKYQVSSDQISRVKIEMEWQDSSGKSKNSIDQASSVALTTYVKDNSDQATGVISAFLSYQFDGSTTAIGSTLSHGESYQFLSGGFIQDNLVLDAGGHATSFPIVEAPSEKAVLSSFEVEARVVGFLQAEISKPQEVGRDILVLGQNEAVPFKKAAIITPPPLIIKN